MISNRIKKNHLILCGKRVLANIVGVWDHDPKRHFFQIRNRLQFFQNYDKLKLSPLFLDGAERLGEPRVGASALLTVYTS